MYGEIRQAEDRLDLDHLSPVDAIRRIVEFTYNYYLEHEGFVRLVVAENQARGPPLEEIEGHALAQSINHRHAPTCSRAR